MSRKHAILSASGAARWMACPPSAQLEESLPEEKSEYAEEGTFAHKYAELQLQKELGLISKRNYEINSKKMKESSEWYCEALEEYIQNYTTIVMERLAEAKARCPDPVVLLEQRLDFSNYVPEGFGTGDVVIIADGILEVIDLKYGKGVPVSAGNNPQLMLYGLGALDMFGPLYDIDAIQMTIIQPRLDNVSTDIVTAKRLYEWANNVVKPKAELAMAGEGEFRAGDHCRFCRAKAICRTRAEANLELAKYDFAPAPTLSVAEIADILTRAEELLAWVKDIQAYALDQAENQNVKYPGWKLVEGRSNRIYTDKETVAEILLKMGYTEEQIYKKDINGITAIEKLLGKKKFSELLGEYVIKPAGKPTLVPESDKRPEISSAAAAAEDFKK